MPARSRIGSISNAPQPVTSRASRRAARRKPASRARGRPECSTGIMFTKAIDEAGPSLVRVDFFNYGEAFLHKRAVEMCEYIKTKFPHIYLYTSTNGLALNEEKARRLVHSGIDEVTFSIDGASQETLRALSATRQIRRRARQPPRHGRRESARWTRCAAAQLALHSLHLERQRRGDELRAHARRRNRASIDCAGRLPTIPKTRFRGASPPDPTTSPGFGRKSGTTTISAMPSPERRRVPGSTFGPGCPGCHLLRSARAPIAVRTRVHNLSNRPFRAQASYGRRLVRLGAQLLDEHGSMINRDLCEGVAARGYSGRRHCRGLDRRACA